MVASTLTPMVISDGSAENRIRGLYPPTVPSRVRVCPGSNSNPAGKRALVFVWRV